MKNFILSESDRDALVNYLVQRPFQEVAQGVQKLLTLEEIKPEEEK